MNAKHFRLPCLLALALAIFETPVHANLLGKLLEAKPIDLTAEPAPTADKVVKCENMKKLKSVKKVVITSFNVQFVTARKANAHSGGNGNGDANVYTDVTLKGLDDSVFQAITDTAYTNFVNELKTNGLEVMPYTEYAALTDYAKMKGAFVTSPANENALFSGLPTRIFAPTGMPIVFYGDEATVGLGAKLAATSAMMSHAPVGVEPEIAKQTGVPAVRVFMLVDFAQVKASGGMFSSSASLKTKPLLAIGRGSRAAFVFDSGYTGAQAVHLVNYAYGNDNYINAYNDVTTTGQKAGDVTVDVLGALSGSGSVQRTKSYEAEADPVAYKNISVKYLAAVNQLWLDAVKASEEK